MHSMNADFTKLVSKQTLVELNMCTRCILIVIEGSMITQCYLNARPEDESGSIFQSAGNNSRQKSPVD